MSDLTSVIEESVAEATDIPVEEVDSTVSEPGLEASEPVSEPSEEPQEASSEVPSPAAKVAAPAVEDEFAKKHGLSPQGALGKENRIPYSRVKKITANAEKARDDYWTSEKSKWDKDLTDVKTKVADYEGRLQQVAQFEHVMVNDKVKFLQMLTQIPGYREIFEQLAAPRTQAQPQAPAGPDPNAMPEPDQELTDGSRVYSMDGLKNLLAWQTKQAEARIAQRYAPIEQEWRANKQIESIIPEINRQVAEARKWPLFSDNEPAIVKALQANPRLSLEGAYRQVVVPQLQANVTSVEEKTRAKVIEELQKAPRSTSAPATQTRPNPIKQGPRSMEAIIADSIKSLK
jgi:hypothetical protein